jgi:hypothetical protein
MASGKNGKPGTFEQAMHFSCMFSRDNVIVAQEDKMPVPGWISFVRL